MVRTGVLIAGAVLAAFHAWLFGSQAVAGRLAEADVAGRWFIALGLLAGLWAMRQRGATPSTRRRSIALWVLAALLHGPALANDHDGFATPAMPEAVVTVAPAAASLSALGLALLTLWRVAQLCAAPVGILGLVALPGSLGAVSNASVLRFLPRPPPLA